MKKTSTLLLLFTISIYSQTFLNGSFEINTSGAWCNYNLANTTFNALMTNNTAYGTANETDIMIDGCYVVGIPNGTYAVGIAGWPQDEIALRLSAPLVAGNSYTMSFWVRADINFRPRGDIEIGLSTTNTTFGTLINTSTTVAAAWAYRSFSFIAPNNGQFITVRNISDGVVHWNHIDHFVFGSPLPVELIDFSVEQQEHLVNIRWSTASEINNDYFTVERSNDAVNYDELTRVKGAGNSNNELQYETKDMLPYNGISYYRLKQTDYDGTYKYSDPISVNFTNQSDLSIFPNPTLDYIQIENYTSIEHVQLSNSWGEIILDESKPSQAISLSHLPAGVYYMTITYNGAISTKKIIKL